MSHSGDYIAFTYGGVHSKDLNLFRVIPGSRYDLQLHPTSTERTINVPGVDGQYYFGTDYSTRPFSLSLAYDNLTEEKVQAIRLLFNPKEIRDLIFDELPYKVYSVKPTGNSNLSFVPFTEGFTGRLYKGEGTVQFVAYTPYARSRYKWREDYIGSNITEWETGTGNLNEWIGASGIRPKGDYDVFISGEQGQGKFNVYNAGDVPTDFTLTIPFVNSQIPYMLIAVGDNRTLHLENIEKKGDDESIRIDTYLGVVEGLSSGFEEGFYSDKTRTGNLYNEFIKSGDFFKLPVGESELITVGVGEETKINYNYLYY